MSWALHPRLDADTVEVGTLPLCAVRLSRDARWPWLVLVPRVDGARELVDLDAADQARLLAELGLASRALQALFAPDKLNLAALGNLVPQLHWHVVARHVHDAAWPRPIWGVGEPLDYASDALAARVQALRGALAAGGLVPPRG